MSLVVTLLADDVQALASWPLVIEAIRDGHRLPKADIGDALVQAQNNAMMARCAYVEGLAAGVKAVTIVPDNPARPDPLPSIHGQIILFDPDTGQLAALVDGTQVTAWKTAGDSALGSALLSREDSSTLLMVGAGSMVEPLIRAHLSVRPCVDKVMIWNRTLERAQSVARSLSDLALSDPALSDLNEPVAVVEDLDSAVASADIISCATMTNEPVLKGALVAPGTHVDLVGAYKVDMREADDELHRRASWFVDSFNTTMDHIGELAIPLARGVINRDSVKGDLHALVAGKVGREDNSEITVFKNGGGAHLDIMVSAALVRAHLAGNG